MLSLTFNAVVDLFIKIILFTYYLLLEVTLYFVLCVNTTTRSPGFLIRTIATSIRVSPITSTSPSPFL